jgi:salicylate hydroxylase
MSPFKGQGANQALLDALSLARVLYRATTTTTTTKSTTTMPLSPLKEYELEMLERSAVKVQASADAADFLHSPIAIQRGNCTRGGAAAAVAAATAAVTATITTTTSSP